MPGNIFLVSTRIQREQDVFVNINTEHTSTVVPGISPSVVIEAINATLETDHINIGVSFLF
ncbi:MAG: hypothetical protein OQK73_05015 [Gammaproteobacteria bacterium]|nr:hypothetical protein [Gammaproteobacteria bacterium]